MKNGVALYFVVVNLVTYASVIFASETRTSNIDTIAGDTSISVSDGRNTFRVYEHIDNNRLKTQVDEVYNLDKAKFYVLGNFIITKEDNGKYAQLFKIGDKSLVKISFKMQDYDLINIRDEIKHNLKYGWVQLGNIHPFPIQTIKLYIPVTGEEKKIDMSGSFQKDETITFNVESSSKDIDQIVELINNKKILPELSSTYYLSTSQIDQYSIDADAIKNTSIYKDYSSPKGPDYITAIQASNIAASILIQVKSDIWKSVGDTDFDVTRDWLLDGLKGKAGIDIPINSQEWTQKLSIDPADYEKFSDRINKIAYDAKNLSDDQWCRKYKKTMKDVFKGARDGSNDLKLNVIGYFSFGFNNKRSFNQDQKTSRLHESSDCGRKQFENSFSYELEGEIYKPKSVMLFENTAKKGLFEGNMSSRKYQVSQTLKTINLKVGIDDDQ